MDEHEMIKRLSAGDSDAFATLFAEYRGKMVGFAMRHVETLSDAEDVVGNLLQKWLEHPPRVEGAQLEGFLSVSVRNAAYDWMRDQQQERGGHPRAPEGVAKPDGRSRKPRPSDIPYEHFKVIAIQALAGLTPTEREALEVHVGRSMSVEEKAAELGITPNAFYQRVHRAVEHWQKEIEGTWRERRGS